jgi:hypothetical protein
VLALMALGYVEPARRLRGAGVQYSAYMGNRRLLLFDEPFLNLP